MKRALLACASLAALAAAVACGGGGGGGQSNLPGGTGGPGGTAFANAMFSITVPSASGASSTQRHAAFVSPNAQSIGVVVSSGTAASGQGTIANLTASSPNCTPATATAGITCTISLNSPVGNDTFTVTLYAGLNGAGAVLASSTVSATIAATGTTTVPVALGGVISSIDVNIPAGNKTVPGGFPTTMPVVVTAKDPSGATIVGSAPYASPITLTNADTSGITTLSTTTVTSPATAVTLAYAPTDTNTGVLAIAGLPVGATTIGATAAGVPATAISPATFQYVADRFFGLGHTRTLTGTGTVVSTPFNGAGVAQAPSTFTYSITDALTVHAGLVFNGTRTNSTHHAITYTQTTPVTATPPETDAQDDYRVAAVTATGATLYRIGQTDVDVNSGAVNSPITGYVPGTTNFMSSYPTPGAWQVDVLPHVSGTTWSNSAVPFTIAWTGAEVANYQRNSDGSFAFNETVPNTLGQTQTATGSATNVNNGFTTTIALPSGGTIPVAEQTTSPVPGIVSNFTPANWYPNGPTLTPPLFTELFSLTLSAIPAPCNVPPAIATQAFASVQVNSSIDVSTFHSQVQVWTDYYVPNGIGYVCETYVSTSSSYRFTTGIIANQTTTTYTLGVPVATALSVRRSQ